MTGRPIVVLFRQASQSNTHSIFKKTSLLKKSGVFFMGAIKVIGVKEKSKCEYYTLKQLVPDQ